MFGFFVLALVWNTVSALTADELQQLIDQKKQEKVRLEEENKKLTEQISQSETQAKDLSGTIKVLDQNAKKLANDIQTTKTGITQTQYEIQQLSLKINDAESRIDTSHKAISISLKNLAQVDDTPILTNFFNGKTLADVWNEKEAINNFNDSLQRHIIVLNDAKKDLGDKRDQSTKKKNELTGLKNNLSVQQKIVLENQAFKTKLLLETKSQESVYQKQLQANIARGLQIEREQFDYESQLKISIDPSKFPAERQGVLSWPITPIKITQKFGSTVDSKRLYLSGTHNGIDIRATVGTPVRAALDGVVEAMGNTDEQSGCYSYGRWVLIRHGNGLSTVYAHLSGATVVPDQAVSTGQIIGFSGGQPGAFGSGYSTGPHLHLGLFATEGVRVQKYTASRFCKNVSIPIAPINGYLDPEAYLPTAR